MWIVKFDDDDKKGIPNLRLGIQREQERQNREKY